MTSHNRIKISSVDKSYGAIKAVDDVTLDIDGGECVALVGPNGAGKSTLIKLILGLIRPTAGTINVLGCDTRDNGFAGLRKSIGFLPEQALFQGALTGRETLGFYTRLKGENMKRIDELLTMVELVEAADRRVGTYSKGMRQRLGLAQALIGTPDILILDEPTSGLDPTSRKNFFKIIEDVKAEGAAILMSSHGLTELEARTDRVAILHRGKLIADGTIKDLKANLALSSSIKIMAGRAQMEQLAEKFSDRYSEGKFVNGVAILECDENQKVGLLKDLMGLGITFDDIELVEPSLEHVFSAYTGGNLKQ